MEIRFHSHHAAVSPRLQSRAEKGIAKLARRVGDAVRATVCFEEDGPTRRVEVTLHAPRGRRLTGDAKARYFGPALSAALNRLGHQLDHAKRTPKARAKRLVRA